MFLSKKSECWHRWCETSCAWVKHLWHRAHSRHLWGGWLLLSILAFAILGIAENPSREAPPLLPLPTKKELPPVWLVFIDSLSDRVALDPSVMPNLASLRAEGASLIVEPCRDRLTYRCLHAVFSGGDVSSLLSMRANFEHDSSQDGTLLHLASERRQVVGLGAHDLKAYASTFQSSWYFPSPEAPESQILEQVHKYRDAGLLLIGFSQGDRIAHALGPGSKEYLAAFQEIDRIVGEIRKEIPSGAHLVVFGDHGHDAVGHHLPGGDATTIAFYQGPAITPNSIGNIHISDHRVLLGILLGLPSPVIYQGTPLKNILNSTWIQEYFHTLPPLEGKAAPLLGAIARVCAMAVLALTLGIASWRLLRSSFLMDRRRILALLVLGLGLRVLGGLAYEPLCYRIHDHGDSPWRAAFLLLPLGGGLLAGFWLRQERWDSVVLLLLVPFFLLFPSANFYGSGRAVVHGALIALGMAALWIWHHAPAKLRRLGAMALAILAMILFIDIRRVSTGAGAQGYFEMGSSLFREHSLLLLIVGKLLGAWLLGCITSPVQGSQWARWILIGSALFNAGNMGKIQLPPELLLLAPVLWIIGRAWSAPTVAILWSCMESIYSTSVSAAFGVLAVGVLGVLVALRGTVLEQQRMVGVLLTLIGGYLMLWPATGMRLAGLDFSFMFRWVPSERYEQFWWLIGLGMIVKLILPVSLPGLLVVLSGGEIKTAFSLMEIKMLSLASFASAWVVVGPMTALAGQEALSELGVLLLVGVGLRILVILLQIPQQIRNYAPPVEGTV